MDGSHDFSFNVIYNDGRCPLDDMLVKWPPVLISLIKTNQYPILCHTANYSILSSSVVPHIDQKLRISTLLLGKCMLFSYFKFSNLKISKELFGSICASCLHGGTISLRCHGWGWALSIVRPNQ